VWITETRALLDSIDTGNVAALRDPALIGLTTYSFGRIGGARGMAVKNVHTKTAGSRCFCASPSVTASFRTTRPIAAGPRAAVCPPAPVVL
jgi:hypothetical protein